jgi:hypothetical protein
MEKLKEMGWWAVYEGSTAWREVIGGGLFIRRN